MRGWIVGGFVVGAVLQLAGVVVLLLELRDARRRAKSIADELGPLEDALDRPLSIEFGEGGTSFAARWALDLARRTRIEERTVLPAGAARAAAAGALVAGGMVLETAASIAALY